MSLIKLSNGVEISEDTIVAALKKAGIETKPKHLFTSGDIAENEVGAWRLILSINGKLQSFDEDGSWQSIGQDSFEEHGYKFIGKLKDLVR